MHEVYTEFKISALGIMVKIFLNLEKKVYFAIKILYILFSIYYVAYSTPQ